MENNINVQEVVEEANEVVEECGKRFKLENLRGKGKEIAIVSLAAVGVATVVKKTIDFCREKKPFSTLGGKIKGLFSKSESTEVIDVESNVVEN